MRSLRLSTAVVAAVFVCLSIMQFSTVAQFTRRTPNMFPPMNACAFPYGLCTSADPSGVACKERCLSAQGRNFNNGICITNPGTCMCCFRFGI
ncbi:unnamed protein product [Eruca vesicaria subsp. sativa]|uniref:Uncharacterized protein n=1 Tax=Eruca vesicaria subsp. sativa TaxID=29727 RepID=A0ABC8JDZ8_ERUVS|nr:unnamed protein product [Eruca vesicaria subsp. sativa]